MDTAPPHPPVRPLPALTALRFVAAAYVLAFHYLGFAFPEAAVPAWIGLGYSGVTFFFVLSGFILAYTYRRVDFSEPGALARFRRARVARILPVTLAALVFALPFFVAWVLKTPPPLQGLMALGAVLAPLGLHAWVPGAACSLNCPSWSISAEAFFYVVFPFLLPVVLARPKAAALVTLAAWAAMSALTTLAWARLAPGLSLIAPEAGGAGPVLLAQAIKYNPLLRLPEFVAGLLLFRLWEGVRVPVPILLATATLAALALVLAQPHLPEPLLHNGLTALAWVPLILAGAGMRAGPLTAPGFVFLGRISFALYLLHAPAYTLVASLGRAAPGAPLAERPWLTVALATGLTLALSAALHLGLEEPARRRLLGRGPAPAARAPVSPA